MKKFCGSLFRSTSRSPALFLLALAGMAAGMTAGMAPTVAAAQNPGTSAIRQDGVKILDYGIYSHSVLGYTDAPNDISGQRFTASNVKLIRKTQTILAQLDLTFGLRYTITDPKLLGRRLTIVVRFPEMTNPANGKSGAKLVDSFIAAGSERRELFRFDYTWEMAEGRWKFQLLDGQRVIAEVPFKVIVGIN